MIRARCLLLDAAARSRRVAPGLILLATLATLALGWVEKSPCLQTVRNQRGSLELNWNDNRQYRDYCYTDVVPLYTIERLDQTYSFPYKTARTRAPGAPRYMEYPVLTGLFQWLNARIAPQYGSQSAGLPDGMTAVVYFDFVALGLAAAWLITVWAAMRLAGRRVWDALLVAVSPLTVMHAFTNFDTIAIAFATTGLLAWSRRRPLLAGVLFGLGGAAKMYPLLLIAPLLLLCWRTGTLRTGFKTAAAAVVAYVVVNAPIGVLYPVGWSEFFRFNATRGADPESLYNAISYFTGSKGLDGVLQPGQVPTVLNSVSAGLFMACCAGIAWIGMTSRRRPRLPQLCFLVVSVFLLTNKVWSPQYSLWLVPLAVLARPRWRTLLTWMLVDALVWIPTMLFYLGEGQGGLPEGYFLVAVLIRDLLVLGLCMLVLRDIYRPEHDVIRQRGDDDPCGGIFDQARDAVRVARWSVRPTA